MSDTAVCVLWLQHLSRGTEQGLLQATVVQCPSWSHGKSTIAIHAVEGVSIAAHEFLLFCLLCR